MLIKYMGLSDIRGFFAGETLEGNAPALVVNVVFDITNDHTIDTSLPAYSTVDPTWWATLKNDPNFLDVTVDSVVPPSNWDLSYGVQDAEQVDPIDDLINAPGGESDV